eukprot:292264-Heterocapsa_arctica.AAC.1
METGCSLHLGGDSLLNLGTASTKRIVIDAGIRLGCTASGTLWAFAFDPIASFYTSVLQAALPSCPWARMRNC